MNNGTGKRVVSGFIMLASVCLFCFMMTLVQIASYAQEKKDGAASAGQEPAAQPAVPASQPSQDAAAAKPAEAQNAPAPQPADAKADAQAPAQPAVEEAASAVDPGNITVNFKGADIRTVLAYIAEVSGVDIVPSPDVKGIVDLKLTNKPWKVALDIILRNYGFVYEREGDIIRVVTIDKLKQEELTTQTFNLNYGKAKEVVKSIKDIVSPRGKVMHDERTNTVLVTDIPTNIYKIGQVVERLDRKTEQVLIEARVIETVLGDTEKLGIDWNVKVTATGAKRPMTWPFTYNSNDKSIFSKYEPLVQTGQTTTTYDAGGNLVTQTPGIFPTGALGSNGFPYIDYTVDTMKNAFTFGTLDFSEFSAILEMLKQRANTDVVSNPRIATLNNNEALINVGQTLNLPKYERNSQTGKMEITGYDAKDLGVILKVVPHINVKQEIVVDLYPQITDLLRYDTLDAASGIVAPVFSARQAKTQIMVKDGDTIFIGGLIKENKVKSVKRVPIIGDMLGDVPGLGMLFTKKETTLQKTELIFFVTVHLMQDGQQLKSAPKPGKAYNPRYTETQQEDKNRKKRKKSKRDTMGL